MREGVCFALQRVIPGRSRETLAELGRWVAGGEPLEMRAAVAAVAEPALLREEETARAALALHRAILEQVLRVQDRRAEGFRVLRQGLGYTVSVVVQAVPGEGFAFLSQLADSPDPDVQWIARENLKKNRLVKHYPEQVRVLEARLQRHGQET
jgi:hypothetical protein